MKYCKHQDALVKLVREKEALEKKKPQVHDIVQVTEYMLKLTDIKNAIAEEQKQMHFLDHYFGWSTDNTEHQKRQTDWFQNNACEHEKIEFFVQSGDKKFGVGTIS